MPPIDLNTTYQASMISLEKDRPSITRTGADIRLPLCEIEKNIGILVGSSGSDNFVLLTPRSPWLTAVLADISKFRLVDDGWDGRDAAAPSSEALDTAEMLAVFLNNSTVRPTFAVDAMGRPTFASTLEDFYLHLTVDAAERITWFAETAGVENFHDDVEFKGRSVPAELSAILQIA